jgi:dTDP-4-dehydrorhamnose reductase
VKVLVLGSQGQLGMCLSDKLLSSNIEVTYASRADIDISDFSSTKKFISALKPQVIINASAYTAVDDAEDSSSDAYMINHLSVSNIANLCLDLDCWLIHISTDYVFDGRSKVPYKEDNQTNPQSVYGKSKLKGDEAIIASSCNYIILRTAWVFSEYGENFAKTMLRLANEHDELRIINDQIGCPTYAQDIAMAINTILSKIRLNKCSSAIYNYCGDRPCSWYFFAEKIFEEAQRIKFKTPKIIHPVDSSSFITKAIRPKYSVLDCSKIKYDFNIDSSDWQDGINKMLKAINK